MKKIEEVTDETKNNVKKTLFREFISSAGAGISVAYTTFPLEGLKKYVQQGMHKKIPRPEFKPYKGSAIFATNIVPTTIVQLMTDKFLKDNFKENSSIYMELVKSGYCGAQGAIFSTIVESCITTQQRLRCGPRDAFRHMFSHGGYLAPLKSYPFIATRDSIYTACMLLINPNLKEYTKDYVSRNNLPRSGSYEYLASFALCFIGAFLSHPFDTIATRVQAIDSKMSLQSAMKDIKNNLGGYKGLYTGFSYRLCLFFIFANLIPHAKKYIDAIELNDRESDIQSYDPGGVISPSKTADFLYALNKERSKSAHMEEETNAEQLSNSDIKNKCKNRKL